MIVGVKFIVDCSHDACSYDLAGAIVLCLAYIGMLGVSVATGITVGIMLGKLTGRGNFVTRWINRN